MKHLKSILIIGTVAVTLGAGILLAGKISRKHVNYITAVDDHPVGCLSCHLYTQKDNFLAKMITETYISPFNLALSSQGDRMYVVGQESNQLLVVDPLEQKVIEKIPVGDKPHSVVISRDNKSAYVSNQWSDQVLVIDLAAGRITDTLSGGNGPAGLALSPDGQFLFVVNSYSSDISVFDLAKKQEIRRLRAGNNPVSATFTPDGTEVYVSSRRSVPVPYGTPPLTEMTITDARDFRVSERRMFENAYIMENVAVTPGGDLVISTLLRPKNLLPSIQVEQGWMMTHGIGILERKEGGKMVQLLLDEPNAYYADPFDVVISQDGKQAYVSHSGVDMISVVDLEAIRDLLAGSTEEELGALANNLGSSSRYVTGRIHTGANPKGMALSPDGKYLYVAERLEDRIAVINTGTLENESSIELGGPKRITVARQGRRLFNNAGHTFQNQYACYTCHPDAHEDGLVYNMAASDMGRNLANVQTLRDIGDIPPYKWNGKNQTIYKQDGMRFSTVLTRTEAFSHKELDALVAYIITGIKNPPNLRYNPHGELTELQQRGKEIFYRDHTNDGVEIPESNRCYTCHPPPYFTNLQLTDVGTLSENDDPMPFDVPQLNNVYDSPPYLHDGRAATLEELWTVYNKEDKHGMANDMTKGQLNDLVEYLKSIGDAGQFKRTEIYQASTSYKTKKK